MAATKLRHKVLKPFKVGWRGNLEEFGSINSEDQDANKGESRKDYDHEEMRWG